MKFKEYKEEGDGVAPQIQKVYSTAHFIVLVLRFKGQTRYLYVGRGGSYQGLYWFSKLPPAKYRIQKDRLLETYRKYLRGHRLDSISLPTNERLFILHCHSKTYKCSFYWFIKGNQGYSSLEFETDNTPRYMHLWEGKLKKRSEARENYLEEFIPVGLNMAASENHNERQDNKDLGEEQYFDSLENGETYVAQIPEKKIKRKIENIKNDIIKIQKGIELEKELQKETFTIPEGRKVKLNGISYRFEGDDSFYKKRDKIFQKIKRLKKALKLQTERLAQTEAQKKGVSLKGEVVRPMQPIWFFRKTEKGPKQSENDMRADFFRTEDGLLLAVGKDAKGNDQLRSQWGKKEDTWFHVEGHRGSHLIVKGDVKPDHFALFGSILRDYSNLDINDIPLIYSKLSKVKGLKGQQGAVTIKNPKHIQVIYLPNWKEIISAHI